MTAAPIQPERITEHRDVDPRPGRYVLYWMQASVRAHFNPALEYAIGEANRLEQPLVVGFGLTTAYPEASARHYRFLLDGLADVATAMRRREVKFVMRRGDPATVAIDLAGDASSVVIDRGYLRHQRAWRRQLLERYDGPVVEIEGDVVVPVETASNKREYAARTIRPKIHRHREEFLVDLATTAIDRPSLGLAISGVDVDDADAMLAGLDVDRSVAPVDAYRGGNSRAVAELRRFLEERMSTYNEHRNQPHTDDVSYLSMFLHYGHISPVYAALEAQRAASGDNLASFLEELIVRRELAYNYVWFERDYHKYSALPQWARNTLARHADDPRSHLYTRTQLERGETHDRYWNAAMAEMRETGYMHNYMRMYWGKKILEWTNTPAYAYRTTLHLNNKYLLDGRDANSFAGVGWVFGLHDRPWSEREVFGTIRYMSADGLERKTDPDAYVRKVEERTGVDLGTGRLPY
jgi:deoxyribodipyrimidine photo-lyase